MLFRVLDKSELGDLVEGFAHSYEVVGPVRKGDVYVFDEVGSDPSRLAYDYDTTVLPPKKYLFEPKTVMMEYDTATDMVTDVPIQATPRVLFGLHACDINAINRLDEVFLAPDFRDPYYEAAREATLIVGISCMPSEHCCCNLWGTGEVARGYDLFLHDIGGRYLVSILSVTAAAILFECTGAREATIEDSAAFQERTTRFKQAFKPVPDTANLPTIMDAYYDDGLWGELGQRCLSCSACSMVCPTCTCFDMRDILDPGGETGQRVRTWDSCCSPEFAMVTHNYNFNKTAATRVRHRFYHKFLGYLTKHGVVQCTGCGRCEIACKANINPRAVINGLQEDAVKARAALKDGGE